jgi:BolA family transcriptional regulator, general stress-responsive regulator
MNNVERIEAIKRCLNDAFNPTHLKITDESHLHEGHPGATSGKGHFTVEICAKTFNHKTRINQHQLIYQALGDLMQNEIHALTINVLQHTHKTSKKPPTTNRPVK